MAIEVTVPDLGDGIDGGDVLEVLVSEGDSIKQDQGILELETDKATVEVPSTHAGTVTKVHVQAGDSVKVGGVILTMEAGAAASPPPEKPEEPAEEPADEPVDEPESPPAAEPVVEQAPAPAAKSPAPPRPTQPVTGPPTRVEPTPVSVDHSSGSIPAGPAVRRFAREVGVELAGIQGSGVGGRITREDVLTKVREINQSAKASNANAAARPRNETPAAAAPPAATEDLPEIQLPGESSSDDWGPIRIERMPKIRKTIAAQMQKSWESVPRVTNFDDADITDLEVIRQNSKADYAARNIKLTTLPFLIKAVATALRTNPGLNAALDMEHEQVIYRDYINIGIAVDTEKGLMVPALRAADQLSVAQIASTLAKLAEKVRNNDFSIADLRGSTFTISNLGAIGGTYSTPIVNVPEVAILLAGRARKMPVVIKDEIKVRLMMPLSLSYDHRLVDGGAAARFLNDVIGYLGTPSRLLMAP